MFYEVWIQPTDGPLTVLERGPKGELGWVDDKEAAVTWAKSRRRRFRNMDFLVRSEDEQRNAEIVYRTLDDAELQDETKEWPEAAARST